MEMYIAWWWMCTLSFYIFCCEFQALKIASFAHLRFLKFDTPLLCMTRLQYMWKALSLCKVNMSGDSTHLYLTPLSCVWSMPNRYHIYWAVGPSINLYYDEFPCHQNYYHSYFPAVKYFCVISEACIYMSFFTSEFFLF